MRDTQVNVIGGHAGTTILPLLSQVKGAQFTDAQIKSISHRIQFGGDEVVKAKAGVSCCPRGLLSYRIPLTGVIQVPARPMACIPASWPVR